MIIPQLCPSLKRQWIAPSPRCQHHALLKRLNAMIPMYDLSNLNVNDMTNSKPKVSQSLSQPELQGQSQLPLPPPASLSSLNQLWAPSHANRATMIPRTARKHIEIIQIRIVLRFRCISSQESLYDCQKYGKPSELSDWNFCGL